MLLYLIGAIIILSLYMIFKERSEKSKLIEESKKFFANDIRMKMQQGLKIDNPKETNVYILKTNTEELKLLTDNTKNIKLPELQYTKQEKFKDFINDKRTNEIFSISNKNHLYCLVNWPELEVQYFIFEKERTSFESIFQNHK